MVFLCLCGVRALGLAQAPNTPQVSAPGGYRIAGTAVSKADGHPLAHARVVVRDAKDSRKFQSMVTSEDGKFEFSGLPAGKYSLEGAKRGFISGTYDQHDQFSTAIVTGAGLDSESLVLRLAPHAVITGKVLDEAGDPVRRATVTLYYDDHSEGVDQVRQSSGAQTDDQGAYEITPLRPGTYFLSAAAQPWYAIHPNSDLVNSKVAGLEWAKSGAPNPEPAGQGEAAATVDRSLDVAYPVTYYADATDPDSATAIPVRGGDRVQVDIHLNPVPALHLFFHVPGNSDTGFTFPQLEQPAFDGSTFVQSEGGRLVSPGVFELAGIPAGHYNIRLNAKGSSQRMNGVDLTKDGEEIDTSSSEAVGSVKISVQVPGEATLPPQLTVGLRAGHRQATAFHAVDAKGEAVLEQVAAGKYEVLVWGPPKRYSIARMKAEGGEVSGHTLTVAAGSAPLVSVILVGGSAEIVGTAKRAGKPFAGAMVVLVPKNPEANRDLFRRDQSDLDGTFALYEVVPGSYTILAIENGWDLDWSQPGVISAYLRNGQTITVGNETGRPMNLGEAIEVQSK